MINKRLGSACVAILCLALGAGAPVAAATLTFASDTTWEAFDASPAVGGASLGQAQFVCLNAGCPSGCPSGAILFGYACAGRWAADVASIPGAHWIWKSVAVTDSADLVVVCLSKVINLVGQVTSATISVAADDFAEIEINGQSVGRVGSVTDGDLAAEAQRVLVTFNAAPYLQSGKNQIVVCAQNGPGSFTGFDCAPCPYYQRNTAGVVFGGTIELDQTTVTNGRSWGSLKILYR